jgi:hypothetical protein
MEIRSRPYFLGPVPKDRLSPMLVRLSKSLFAWHKERMQKLPFVEIAKRKSGRDYKDPSRAKAGMSAAHAWIE